MQNRPKSSLGAHCPQNPASCMMIGELDWEKVGLIKALKHLAALFQGKPMHKTLLHGFMVVIQKLALGSHIGSTIFGGYFIATPF